MIVYFSWSGNTEVYAEELAKKKGLTTFQLKEKTERKGKISFVKGCLQGIMKQETPVVKMPDVSSCNEIFVCTPIWASGPAPAVRYFLRNADLKNKKLNFLFTYGGMTDSDVFKKQTGELLEGSGCVIGDMYAFVAKFKQQPNYDAIRENIGKVVK